MSFDLKKYQREYQRNRRANPTESDLLWLAKNKERIADYQKNYRLKNREKIKARIEQKKDQYNARRKEHYIENKARLIKVSRQYHINNKEQRRKYHKERYANPETKAKVRTNVKNRYDHDINFKIKSATRNRLNAAIKNNQKAGRTIELLGCTFEFFKEYIAKQFKKGMRWDNYGYRTWHIDHVIPCAKFNLSDPEQQKICFHYTNLQPLWATENQAKGDKIKTPIQIHLPL